MRYLGREDDIADRVETYTTVVRSYRHNQNEQIQVSLLADDGDDFISFRRLIHSQSYLVVLKLKGKFEYEMYGVKNDDNLIYSFVSLNNQFKKLNTKTFVEVSSFIVEEDKDRKKDGHNTLLYGVPGSGKSHTIDEQYCKDESKITRVVFHPDYMNTDFIGQILPTVDKMEILLILSPQVLLRKLCQNLIKIQGICTI